MRGIKMFNMIEKELKKFDKNDDADIILTLTETTNDVVRYYRQRVLGLFDELDEKNDEINKLKINIESLEEVKSNLLNEIKVFKKNGSKPKTRTNNKKD